MSDFKIGLLKVLGDASATTANGYEVETVHFGNDEATLDLADDTQLTLKEQEVVVDEFGESTAVDENGDEVDLKFQSTIPYKTQEMMQRPRIVVLMGDDGQAPEVTSNVAFGVLVLRHGQGAEDRAEDERFVVEGLDVRHERLTVVGDVSYQAFSGEQAKAVQSAFEAERANRERFIVEVLGVDEDGHEFPVGTWASVGCATEEAARDQAIDEVWDRRLDMASCSPKTVVKRSPRWQADLEAGVVVAD